VAYRRRAVTAALYPLWTVGALLAAAFSLLRWAWAAIGDGWSSTLRWRWAPLVGFGLLALAATVLALTL